MQSIIKDAEERANKLLEQLRQDAAGLDQPSRGVTQPQLQAGRIALRDAIAATEKFLNSLIVK